MTNLLSEQTIWIFLLASSTCAESRHIYDVANGVRCLENRGISPNNIYLIIDGDKKTISEHLKIFTCTMYDIKSSNNLENIIKNSTHKNIVLFVAGHGNLEQGIIASPGIKPYNLVNIFKYNENISNVVIYLSQCYAGIFNYIDVTQKKPTIILVGATNLYPSISSKIKNNGWQANLFLYNLFGWIENPIDIDGDGRYTVMDSYKYAGAITNQYCSASKGISLENTLGLLKNKKEVLTQIGSMVIAGNNLEVMSLMRELEAIEINLRKCQEIHYNSQEPWILNAIPAQRLYFEN